MKSYTKKLSKKPFNWNAFLSKESYTEADFQEAQGLSKSWATCACGTQCDIIPRDDMGRPLDTMLDDLGLAFSFSIEVTATAFKTGPASEVVKNLEIAKSILKLIEKRSAAIIKKLTQNP